MANLLAPRRRLLWLSLLLFANVAIPQQDENGPKMYDIQPRGGPVLGGTRMTVLGESLTGLDCVLGDATPEDELDPILAAQGLDGRFRTPCAPNRMTYIPSTECFCLIPPAKKDADTEEYITGPMRVEIQEGMFNDMPWTPFEVFYTYFEHNTQVQVTSIRPSAGGRNRATLVTLTGIGFADYGGVSGPGSGVFCSFPGAYWNDNYREMPIWIDEPRRIPEPDALGYDFTAKATVVDSTTALCKVPPIGNNTSPVFLELCLSGHPDWASAGGRKDRDRYCTSSLVRFEYLNLPQTNLSVWNVSRIAGPTSGGTPLTITAKDFEGRGLPDYGAPVCVFGEADGRHGAVATEATLDDLARPLMYWSEAGAIESNATVTAAVGRQRMCRGPAQSEVHRYCHCTGLCECGCRQLLKTKLGTKDRLSRRDNSPDELDMCKDRARAFDTEPQIRCGPQMQAYHIPIYEQRAREAYCVTPPHLPGRVTLEYSPNGDVLATSDSRGRRMRFEFYEAAVSSVMPRGIPLTGGTPLTVSGVNLWAHGVATIAPPNGSTRVYDDDALCFFGDTPLRNATATVVCDADARPGIGWAATDPPREARGCDTLVCNAPHSGWGIGEQMLSVSLNGEFHARLDVGDVEYFDLSLVTVSDGQPHAGPNRGGTVISVVGDGFRDFGNAACVLTLETNRNAEMMRMPARIYDNRTLYCVTPDARFNNAVRNVELLLTVTMNGDFAAKKWALGGSVRSWFFVDPEKISFEPTRAGRTVLDPAGGPLSGGSLVVVKGIGLKACRTKDGDEVCPRSHEVCPGADKFEVCPRDNGGRSSNVGGHQYAWCVWELAKGRTVTEGRLERHMGSDAFECEVPHSGVAGEQLTGLTPDPASLSVKLKIAVLGTLDDDTLIDVPVEYRYNDAALHAVAPLGGPRAGGTALRIDGRGLVDLTTITTVNGHAVGKERTKLWHTPLCVWLWPDGAGLPGDGAAYVQRAEYAPLRIAATTAASLEGTTSLRCVAPPAVLGVGTTAAPLRLEVSLNGFAIDTTRAVASPPAAAPLVPPGTHSMTPIGTGDCQLPQCKNGGRLAARPQPPISPTLTRPPTFSPYRRRHAHRPQPRATAPPLPPLTPRTAPPPQACRAAYARVSPPRNARRGAGPNPTASRRRLRRGFALRSLRWKRRARVRAKR